MIDKSIRQHYQDGKKVGPFKRGMEMIMPKLKAQALPQEGKKLPNIIKAPLQRAALNKLGLGALNPVLGLLSLLGIDPMAWLGGKMTQGGALQAFQTGFGSPQEQKELRVLENRRAKMLQRKEEGRNYSEKNLDMVTRAVAQAKGLDINNPNEMRNIDKPITQIQIEKRVTEPQIIPEEPEIKSPFAKVIPETPEIISPHLGGDTIIPSKPYIAPIAGGGPDVWDVPTKPTVKETAPISIPVPAHIRGGNGGGGGYRGGAPSHSTRSLMSKGGRIDGPLTGRSRDI